MTEPVAVDPAVRSVRIAAALCERFEELMRGPTQIRATRNRRSLIGVTGDEEGMSLRLGEAQALYPQIWSHLDDARKAFAAKGSDVTGYDGLRIQEGAGMGANVHTTEASHGYGRYGYDEYTKTADFNVAGLARARQAIAVLMSVTPQIDWVAIVAAENNDPAIAEFNRNTKRKRVIQFSLLAGIVIAPFLIVQYMHHRDRVQRDEWRQQNVSQQTAMQAPTLSDAQLASLMGQAKVVRENVDKAREGWPDSDDIAAAVPSAKPCAVKLSPLDPTTGKEFVTRADIDQAAFASTDFYAYPKDAVIGDEEIQRADRSLKLIEARIAAKSALADDAIALTQIAQRVNFVVLESVSQPNGPELGRATGKGYVFDFATGKIVCAGSFDVTNDVDDPLATARKKAENAVWRGMLERELEVRIRNALAANMHGL